MAQPDSGFYCPGRADDDKHGGSKPILVQSGMERTTTAETVEAAEVTFTINATGLPPNTALRPRLAAHYGVAPSDVAVRALPDGGGLAVTIATDNVAEGDRIAASVTPARSDELSAALNASVVGHSSPVVTPRTRTKQVVSPKPCPAGARLPMQTAQHARTPGSRAADPGICAVLAVLARANTELIQLILKTRKTVLAKY